MRNRDVILRVLERVLPAHGFVLEVASGTGEHAAWFAKHFPGLVWQPSDADPALFPIIAGWAREGGAANLRPPLVLDAAAASWPFQRADAVVCINMIHIAPWQACQGLMAGAGRILGPSGVLYLYGPYHVGGRPTAPSNAQFDRDLRRQDGRWGVRNLEDVVAEAAKHDLAHAETVPMPANNLSVVFRKDLAGCR